jgi:hypothetical protein
VLQEVAEDGSRMWCTTCDEFVDFRAPNSSAEIAEVVATRRMAHVNDGPDPEFVGLGFCVAVRLGLGSLAVIPRARKAVVVCSTCGSTLLREDEPK